MVRYAKIPADVRKAGAIAIGAYAIFCKGVLLAAKIGERLHREDLAKGIPAVGIVTVERKKYYYCRYGFLRDEDIYAKSKQKNKRK